ncbi:hypothetical protein JNA64_05045 [Pseudomonas stutzeri]|uniref:hypothetical protein n=1 Tax=Stutzerimonas stutzeri TaxID=316 RepID=UPI001F51AE2C|nr:hypothetical protein [Stutzerimonas stutzeri]MCI0916524.1 hypothetical protein [Stutzerimonas stutzeri]
MAGKPTLRLPLIALPILLLTALTGWLAHSALDAPASVSETSPLGNYLIESVPLTGLLAPGGGLAYLRIINRQLPERVYRSPLYAVQSVDMRVSEDERTVGVTWINFVKREERFILSIPEWRPDWRNALISNTPYEVIPNG